MSDSNLFGWTFSVQRSVTDRTAVEVLGATEQSGTVVGRCDDLATPRDPRCTNRFMTLEFGGASVAVLGVVRRGLLHLGAGPAMLLANWEMQPAHLAGLWIDATCESDRFPLFARAQYRLYRSTSLPPAEGFSAFHPSTLYLGMGLTVSVDDSPR